MVSTSNSVLVLAPHADDEVIGCGGAILNHIQNGDKVHILFFTIGGNIESEQNKIRFQEMLNALKVLNVPEKSFSSLNQIEQKLESKKSIKDYVFNKILLVKPDIIYCPNKHELDKDHRVVNQIIEELIIINPHIFREIYYYEVWSALSKFNRSIDITTCMERKILALFQYRSQLFEKRYDLCVKALNFYRGVMQENGAKYAEVFYRRKV